MICKPGIYRIDGPNGKVYVGSAKNISKRLIDHKRRLRSGGHVNQKLQNAWNAYGEESFTFHVMELVYDKRQLIEREQFWIDYLDAVKSGYNILMDAKSRLGLKASDETRKKQSDAHKGRKHGPMSDEQKAYLSSLYKGKKRDDEFRRRVSEGLKGRRHSEETIKKLSEAKLGRKFSDEHRMKLSLAKLGRKQSPEHIAKRKEGMRLARLNSQSSVNQTI